MGKERAPWQKQKDGHHGWSYWKGSWQSGRSPDPKAAAMPRYDRTQVKKEDHATASDLMRAIQKALSVSSRADQKIKKLAQAKAQKDAQWKQFGVEMKQAYDNEHRKYVADKNKIEQDLESTMEQGNVKTLASRGLEAAQSGVTPTPPPASGWEELIAGGQDMRMEIEDGLLRDAVWGGFPLCCSKLQDCRFSSVWVFRAGCTGCTKGRWFPASPPACYSQLLCCQPCRSIAFCPALRSLLPHKKGLSLQIVFGPGATGQGTGHGGIPFNESAGYPCGGPSSEPAAPPASKTVQAGEQPCPCAFCCGPYQLAIKCCAPNPSADRPS